MQARTIIAAAAAASLGALSYGSQAASSLVDQTGQTFSQLSLRVNRGDAVVFANRDDVTHNITVSDDAGDPTDLGLQKPGQDLTYAFDSAGRFRVRCSIHPSMKMTVDVT